MPAPFVLILVGLNLAVPVRCYETPAAWEAAKAQALAPTMAGAFYAPESTQTALDAGGAYVALGPRNCLHVRRATAWGAKIMGHEFGHRWQDEQGIIDAADTEEERLELEAQADRIADRNQRRWRDRLRRYFKIPADPPVVRLAP